MIQHISTKNAPTPGLYSQGIIVEQGRPLLFISGQTGNIPNVDGEPVIEGGVGPQTIQALKNILAIVRKANVGFLAKSAVRHFVALDIFLKDPGTPEARTIQRNLFNAAYEKFFKDHGVSKEELPARCMVWVSEVPLESPLEDTLVEIKGIAVI